MSYYLQMDGVDDYISVPSMTFNKVELSFSINEEPTTIGWIWHQEWNGLRLNVNRSFFGSGVSVRVVDEKNNSVIATLPLNTVVKVDITQIGTKSSASAIGRYTNNDPRFKGNIYYAKYYLDNALLAHYDMSTGTVQDQSGNGNHATLVGGTWVEGGGTEPEPTKISVPFPTKQVIFKQIVSQFPTKQEITTTSQTIVQFPTKQIIVKRTISQFITKQQVYKAVISSFPTLQVVVNPLMNYSVEFLTKQAIYKETNEDVPIKQNVYVVFIFDAPINVKFRWGGYNMNLGEAKERALSLMAEYSVNGVIINSSTNADYLNRMNRFADDAQLEISDKVSIDESYTIYQSALSQEGFNKYILPGDFKEHGYINLNDERITTYRIENGKLLIPKHIDGVIEHFYSKNPMIITKDTPDIYEFEVDRHAQRIIPYYMGGMAIHDENPQIGDRLLNLYYSGLQNLNKKADDFPSSVLNIFTI